MAVKEKEQEATKENKSLKTEGKKLEKMRKRKR